MELLGYGGVALIEVEISTVGTWWEWRGREAETAEIDAVGGGLIRQLEGFFLHEAIIFFLTGCH